MNCPYAHPGKSTFYFILGTSNNMMEMFMKSMMMGKGQNFGNKNMIKKRRPTPQQDAKEEDQPQQ